MENFILYIKIMFIFIGAVVGAALGGYDKLIIALSFLTVLDIATGLCKCFMCKSEKTDRGGFSSREMWMGGLRKMLMFSVIMLAVLADYMIFNNSQVLRDIAIFYYLAAEALSVLENISMCGVEYPSQIQKIFEQIREKENPRLGEMLVSKGLITEKQLDEALKEQNKTQKEQNKEVKEDGKRYR